MLIPLPLMCEGKTRQQQFIWKQAMSRNVKEMTPKERQMDRLTQLHNKD